MSTWNEVLARIEQVVDRTEYDTWLANQKAARQAAAPAPAAQTAAAPADTTTTNANEMTTVLVANAE